MQRWVLAELDKRSPHWFTDYRGRRRWDGGWESVVALAAYWHHERTCCADRDCRHLDFDPPRAAVETVRRAAKVLAERGRAEISTRQLEVPVSYRVPRAERIYADDRRRGEGHRLSLRVRSALSVEGQRDDAAAQHLEREESDRITASIIQAGRRD